MLFIYVFFGLVFLMVDIPTQSKETAVTHDGSSDLPRCGHIARGAVGVAVLPEAHLEKARKQPAGVRHKILGIHWIASGNLLHCELDRSTTFNGKIHYFHGDVQ